MRAGYSIRILALWLGVSGLWTCPIPAQDFRIYTAVTDLSRGDKAKPRSSLTLFHAGKVYDYIEAAEETVIQDPAHDRFLVLSRRHQLATEITHDEVRRFLGLAHTQARNLITDWQRQGAEKRAAIAALEFQLLPEFEVRDHEDSKTLTLISPHLRYDVVYAQAPEPEIVETYLRSADWTAQLNAVLNPYALLPECRLRVNDELRKRGVLPVQVELQVNGETPVHLKATHEWTWKLLPIDRKVIDDREMQLRQADFRLTPFVEFQRETLASLNRKK